MAVNTTITYNGQTYRADANGALTPVTPTGQDGWVQSGGKWYFYDKGIMVTNTWVKAKNLWYYMGSDGAMCTNTWVKGKNGVSWYYVGGNGVMLTSTIATIGSNMYYFDSNGILAVNQWISYNGKSYYADATGVLSPNGPGGDTPTPTTEGWVQSGDNWYYYHNGEMVKSAWVKTSSWYYMQSNGVMATNMLIVAQGKLLYVSTDGKLAVSRAVSIQGRSYNAAADGTLTQSNTSQLPNQSGNAAALSAAYNAKSQGGSWQQVNGRWRFNTVSNTQLTNTWINSYDNNTYYVGFDGWMAYDRVVIAGNQMYYVNSSGHLVRNQNVQIGNATYYADSTGALSHARLLHATVAPY
jgi:glucan-binding YG repeat protein